MSNDTSPIDNNDAEMTDEEAVEIAKQQTASMSENADKADRDWEVRDQDAPKPL